MRPHRMALACCLVSLSLSCAGPKRYARLEKVQFTLRLWVQDHPALSKEDALKGCREWIPKGVACVMAESPYKADVRVTADMKPCVPDKEGKRTLALAYKGGDVTFMMQCFKQSDGSYDLHAYRAVMTHEVGHELGIWEHVPEECDGKEAKPLVHYNGKKVCGDAVMNRYYEKKIWFVTEIDSLAFDMRDMEYSVIVPAVSEPAAHSKPELRPKPEGPDCTYYGK